MDGEVIPAVRLVTSRGISRLFSPKEGRDVILESPAITS